MTTEFGYDSFAGCLQQTFQLSNGDDSHPLLLISADRHAKQPDNHHPPGFSLLFQGPREPVLPQRMYRLNHDRLGEFDLFIVPIGADDEGVHYEAVFS